MRAVLLLGRQCLRPHLRAGQPAAARSAFARASRPQSTRSAFSSWSPGRAYTSLPSLRAPPRPRFGGSVLLFAATTALSPAAFVALSQQSNDDDDRTGEQLMLEASRAELKNQVPKVIQHSKTFRKGLYFFFENYIWEPLATGLRFAHLVVIFVPVILTVPVIWIGRRVPDRDNERSGTLWWYAFLVRSMERAGAAFIKLGQWAASRTDIFPTEMCKYMSSLHSNAPAHSLHDTKRIVKRAFDGRDFEDIFDEFDEKPLGVGAIAQVYRAKLKPDLAAPVASDVDGPQNLRQVLKKNVGATLKSTPHRIPSSYVAIKVLHPNIEKVVRRDLRIMSFFAHIINAIPTMEWLSFPDEVKQFSEMMRLQLDLRIEGANLTLFRRNFKDRTTAWFPFPYNEYTTRQVLVEEFAHGIALEDLLQNGGGSYRKEIADEGLNAFLHMVLIDNFIHADLHPGNIMVRFYKPETPDIPSFKTRKTPEGVNNSTDVTEEVIRRLTPLKGQRRAWNAELQQIDNEGYRPQLIFIDTGLVTELNEKNRKNFLDLFKAVAEFDGYKSGHLMVERCRQPEAVLDKEVFALKMQHLVLGVKSRTFALGNIKIGDILNEVLTMVRQHHVRLEGDFVNVVLSILLLEGIGRQLDPEMDLFAGALPILRKLGTQSGRHIVRDADFSMLKVWAGLEARSWLRASVESVEACVKYDLLSPNI
ncbi:ABC1 family protein C21C3.03 [Lasiodiplodia hormozganensis]|uniref:ABC1 family protein C21C3.03 n=1 Tax=Lasiodiplodia hormozganensis TaxID=869390 RepID=A0AA39Z2F4_9PEZI|nr:ABC1 family protein C21C3.03 [Lasiodiplodia hormozganensis]